MTNTIKASGAAKLARPVSRDDPGEVKQHFDTANDMLNAMRRWEVTHDPKWILTARAIRIADRYRYFV